MLDTAARWEAPPLEAVPGLSVGQLWGEWTSEHAGERTPRAPRRVRGGPDGEPYRGRGGGRGRGYESDDHGGGKPPRTSARPPGGPTPGGGPPGPSRTPGGAPTPGRVFLTGPRRKVPP